MHTKRFLSLVAVLLGLVILARPSFILLTHNFQEEADNAYFIYKHVKKRKQDFDDSSTNVFISRTENSVAKRYPFIPSAFITAPTKQLHSYAYAIAVYHPIVTPGTKTYLLTGKLTI